MANCLPFGFVPFVSGVSRFFIFFVPSFSFKVFQSAPLPTVQESVVPKAQCFWQWKHVETGHTVIPTVPYYCHTGHTQFRCDFSSDFSSIFAEAVIVRLWVEKWKLVTCNLQAQCVNSHIYIYIYTYIYRHLERCILDFHFFFESTTTQWGWPKQIQESVPQAWLFLAEGSEGENKSIWPSQICRDLMGSHGICAFEPWASSNLSAGQLRYGDDNSMSQQVRSKVFVGHMDRDPRYLGRDDRYKINTFSATFFSIFVNTLMLGRWPMLTHDPWPPVAWKLDGQWMVNNHHISTSQNSGLMGTSVGWMALVLATL